MLRNIDLNWAIHPNHIFIYSCLNIVYLRLIKIARDTYYTIIVVVLFTWRYFFANDNKEVFNHVMSGQRYWPNYVSRFVGWWLEFSVIFTVKKIISKGVSSKRKSFVQPWHVHGKRLISSSVHKLNCPCRVTLHSLCSVWCITSFVFNQP